MKLKCCFSLLKLIKFLTEVISRGEKKSVCYLSKTEFKAHIGSSNFQHVYLFFSENLSPSQHNLICRHIPALSVPLGQTGGLFISGCFPQTSDSNAAWSHRLPPCAPRNVYTAASSLLPSQPLGLFPRQLQAWHCASFCAGQRRQHLPMPGKFPGPRCCKIH